MVVSERRIHRFVHLALVTSFFGNFCRNTPNLDPVSPKEAFTATTRRLAVNTRGKKNASRIGIGHVYSVLERQQVSNNSSLQQFPRHRCNNLEQDFPLTQFTPYLKDLVEAVNLHPPGRACTARFRFEVTSPGTIPEVSPRCKIKPDSVSSWWLKVLQERIFSNAKGRVIPGNVTLRLSLGDWTDPNKNGFSCFGASAPNGTFTVTNFLEIQRLMNYERFPTIPWEQRTALPVWRGSPWTFIDPRNRFDNSENETTVLEELVEMKKVKRLPLVLFSRDNPDLVDAGLSSPRGLSEKLWEYNTTNGLHKLLPIKPIDKYFYYSRYQVALVMGGVGAAFRTPSHLSTGTAVVLQDYHVEEWYVRFMQPYVHYIPLARDLSDLNKTLHWVRNNPEKVKTIAKTGQDFYEKYLSFDRTEEFLYELIYRLALKENNHESTT
jgi:hypothetical protein